MLIKISLLVYLIPILLFKLILCSIVYPKILTQKKTLDLCLRCMGHKRVPYSQNVPVALLKHLTLSNNPFIFQRTNTLVKIFIKQTAKQNAETVIRFIPSEKSIYWTHLAHTNHDNGKESDKNKVRLSDRRIGQKQTSHQFSGESHYQCDEGLPEHEEALCRLKNIITDAARATSETYGRLEDF